MPSGLIIAAGLAALAMGLGVAMALSGAIAAVVPTCGPVALRRPLPAVLAAFVGLILFVWGLDAILALWSVR